MLPIGSDPNNNFGLSLFFRCDWNKRDMCRRDSKRQLKEKTGQSAWLGKRHLTYPTMFNFSLAFKATDGICCSKISASLIQKATDMVFFFSFVYWSRIFVVFFFCSRARYYRLFQSSATFCRIFFPCIDICWSYADYNVKQIAVRWAEKKTENTLCCLFIFCFTDEEKKT